MVLDVGAVPGGSSGMPGAPVRKQTGQGGALKSQRAAELIALGDKMFMEKAPLNALCQEIAENVYPERADFTTVRYLGENFSDHLMDSFPQLARRELGNSISAIQRPRGKPWFAASTRNDELDNDPAVARFLEYVTNITRNKMYDPRTDMVGATKIADHDYVTFGQCVLTIEEGPSRQHLFNRSFHFRDVVFLENEISQIDHVHRKERMSARQMAKFFPRKMLAPEVTQALEKAPGTLFNIRAIVMPADEYDTVSGKATWGTETSGGSRGDGDHGQAGGFAGKGFRGKCPYVAIYVDADHQVVLKEQQLRLFPYLIPRWHRISGFQYAFSPASMTSLPDARMMQMMTRIILESGEKAVDPPILALEDRVREANLGSGMITWVDAAYDGKLDDALKPLHLEPDLRLGMEMRKDLRDMFARCWFLDKIALPPESAGSRTTAYEVARRIEEHVRNLLPLFEPMEIEYSNRLLDKTFYTLDLMKAYDWSLMPDALSGKDIFWSFINPMQEASQRILVSQFGEVMQLIKAAQEFGLQASPVKLDVALKDAIRGTSAPATWRKTPEEEQADAAEAAKRQQIAGMAQEMATAGQVAQSVGKGAQAMQEAGIMKQPGQGGPPQQAQQQQGPPIPLPPPQLAPRQQAPALPTFNPAEVGPPGQAGQ